MHEMTKISCQHVQDRQTTTRIMGEYFNKICVDQGLTNNHSCQHKAQQDALEAKT
jgi:hypothetical protein